MELYRKVRLACRDGMSERAAARHFGVSRESVRKMLEFSVPPGYRRKAPVRRPKLDGFTGLIDGRGPENSALAARLIEQTCLKQGIEPHTLTLHSDRGAPMTSKCTARLLADLGVTRSLSRPQVSDDNPFSEAQLKTLKYHPTSPGGSKTSPPRPTSAARSSPGTTPSIVMPESRCSPLRTSTMVRAGRVLEQRERTLRFAWTGTQNDSCTEPRSPSLFPKRSGSTRGPRPRRLGLLSKSQPPLSQCR